MAYEFFYPGASYPLEPSYGELFTGYHVPFSEIGAPTSIQTANQIQEVTNLLSQGGKTIELQPIQPEVFDAIPKQHFKEINRLTKLTGTETTVHAPMIDPSGFTKEGWSEAERQEAERQLKSVVERSHELSPDGNIPITIHASAIPGTEYSKPTEKMKEDYKRQFKEYYGREAEEKEIKHLDESQIIAVNQETGQLVPIKREEKFYPDFPGGKIYTPEENLEIINRSEWHQKLSQLAFYKQRGDEILRDSLPLIAPKIEAIGAGKIKVDDLSPQEKAAYHQVRIANTFMSNVLMTLNSIYNEAYKFSDPEQKKKVLEDTEKFREALGKKGETNIIIVSKQSEAVSRFIEELGKIQPKLYKKVEDFAVDKSAQTLGNTAFEAYKNYGDKSPIISIENLYPGMAFSKSEELKKLVEGAREKFVEKAKKQGMSTSEAQDAAKKLIGVTWDVGHLNMLRKAGYNEEEIRKETEKIAKFVKHVHLTDNFGFTDSHLPPGMGNVPIKKILEELEKAGFKGKKIIEAGGFVQHFKVSPASYILEAMGSPLYSMMAQPYWNQITSTYGRYFALPSAYLPEQHFSIYGSSFSTLPVELGGQMAGKQSRMTGTPME